MTTDIKFGTDGWRAIIAEDFTFENVILVTKAIAAYIMSDYDESKPVLVGYDTRFLADKFAQKAAETLNSLGLNVKKTNRDVPTPVIAFAAKNLDTAGAIMFTASHNPPEYCGIKYIPDYAGPATTDITDVIVNNVKRLQSGENIFIEVIPTKGKTEIFDPKPAYFDWIKKLIDFEKIKNSNIKSFYDPIYSTGRGYFDGLLKETGCNITTIHDWIDPLYGGGMPEPKEKYLQELINMVRNNYPSLGFSTDGDSDRFGVIDEKGNYITPNEMIAILLKHLIKNKKRTGKIVKSVAVSRMIDKIASQYGIEVIETPVGFKWIGQQMRENEVIIGGEESGGLSIWGHIPEKDGILANLSILEAVAYENKPLFQIVEDLKKEIGGTYINYRLDLEVTESQKEIALKMFKDNPPKTVGSINIKMISNLDGMKFYFEDESWMLIRPSGTEPLFRIYFETDSQEKLDMMIADVKKLVNL